MSVSFIIPAHNEEHLLPTCLQSIFSEIKRTELQHTEVIVVDNGSTDHTADMARAFGATVISCAEKGLTKAKQAGHNAATNQFEAYIDADNILPTGWLTTALKAFNDPAVVGASGPLVFYDLPEWHRKLTRVWYGIADPLNSLMGRWLQGGNYIVRKRAIDKIGGYDTSIDFYGEDTAIAKRLSRVGKIKFLPGLRILSSGRRLEHQGIFNTGMHYALNYFSVTLFGKPVTKSHEDYR
jgi:glycosyltransferase involved in cell wall biosynthesis